MKYLPTALLCLLLALPQALPREIHLGFNDASEIRFTCKDAQPGHCCTAWKPFDYAVFAGLEPDDIIEVFQKPWSRFDAGCSGTVMAQRMAQESGQTLYLSGAEKLYGARVRQGVRAGNGDENVGGNESGYESGNNSEKESGNVGGEDGDVNRDLSDAFEMETNETVA